MLLTLMEYKFYLRDTTSPQPDTLLPRKLQLSTVTSLSFVYYSGTFVLTCFSGQLTRSRFLCWRQPGFQMFSLKLLALSSCLLSLCFWPQCPPCIILPFSFWPPPPAVSCQRLRLPPASPRFLYSISPSLSRRRDRRLEVLRGRGGCPPRARGEGVGDQRF
jgi:hypothetical protein